MHSPAAIHCCSTKVTYIIYMNHIRLVAFAIDLRIAENANHHHYRRNHRNHRSSSQSRRPLRSPHGRTMSSWSFIECWRRRMRARTASRRIMCTIAFIVITVLFCSSFVMIIMHFYCYRCCCRCQILCDLTATRACTTHAHSHCCGAVRV